jgi:hypothetical protein
LLDAFWTCYYKQQVIYTEEARYWVVRTNSISIPVIAGVARGQQEGLQYSRDNNVIQNNNIVKRE